MIWTMLLEQHFYDFCYEYIRKYILSSVIVILLLTNTSDANSEMMI